MSKQVELIMPKMGESIAEATILKWLKQEGDKISIDEAVLEIATDKVDSEVPSPVAGTISKLLFKEGDVVEVGKAVAMIATEGAASGNGSPAPEIQALPVQEEEKVVAEASSAQQAVITQKPLDKAKASRFYSPLVLSIARNEGIGMDELEKINGTGKEGRVTKKDIFAYVENRETPPAQQRADTLKISTTVPQQNYEVDVPVYPGDEIIEMDRMRKLISEHMVMSKHVSPHVTSFVEADVTNIVVWREKAKKTFEQREGEKLTFTPLFIEAVIKALKDFPMVNISLSGNKIIKRKNINIGMAAALPTGNLIVPVIRNADEKSLIGLTRAVNDLANRARQNKLKPEEIQEGTFTITNVGTFGNVMGTPIINQPQVAILATGAIRKKPAVIETPQGDTIGIRHMMYLSLSYDHRIVDGMMGGSFLRRIADYLEGFDFNRSV